MTALERPVLAGQAGFAKSEKRKLRRREEQLVGEWTKSFFRTVGHAVQAMLRVLGIKEHEQQDPTGPVSAPRK